MMNWWLDRGIDGFRMDVINLISKVLPLQDGHDIGPDGYASGFHLVMNGPRIHEFLKEMHREVFAGRDRMLAVGEMPGVSTDDAIRYTNPDEKEVDMVFQFDHMMLDRGLDRYHIMELDLRALKAVLGHWQTSLYNLGWNSLYWNNHDQPRVVSRFGNDGKYRVESAKMLGTILHMLQGTPYIYQGEEFGMTNYPFTKLEEYQDIEARNYAAAVARLPDFDQDALMHALANSSRDNARTPVQWDDSMNAGFTTGIPWMPVHPNAGMINAKQALADEDSVFHYYRRLIQLRHNMPVVVYGEFELLLEDDERVFAYTRRYQDEQLLVLGNFSDDEVPVSLDKAANWISQELLIGNYPAMDSGTEITLRPWETRVYYRHWSRTRAWIGRTTLGDWGAKKTGIVAGIAAVILFVGIIVGLYMLGGDHQSALEKLRDIAIIFSQLLMLVTVILLAAITAALVWLIMKIKDQVMPILDEGLGILREFKGTATRVKNTTNFVTEEAARPIVAAAGQVAKVRAMSRFVTGKTHKVPDPPTFKVEKKEKK
jgi:oligo-1,6-glucosidase